MGFSRGPSIVTDGLVLALDAANTKSYPGSGTTWTDLSGNGTTGTLTNGPTFDSGNQGSIDFDGTNDYALLGNSSQFNLTNKISVLAWVNAESNTGWNGIFGTISGGTFIHFQTYNGGPNAYVYGPNAGYSNLDSTTVTQGQWNQLGFTFYNSTLTMYVNGASLETTVTTNSNNITSTTTAGIGRVFSGDRYMNGKIAGVSIYNVGLSSEQILQNYNATKSRFGL